MRVLVVDDEPALRAYLAPVLTRAGFTVETAESGEVALAAVVDRPPDAVVLDVNLPDLSGLSVCRRLRRRPDYLPVVLLTVLAQRDDELAGFAALADDYVTKPVDAATLIARLRAVIRLARAGELARGVRRFGDLQVDLVAGEVRRGNRLVRLRAREFRLLAYLVEHPDRVHGPTQLLGELWGVDSPAGTAAVAHNVWRLRQAVEVDPARPRHLLTRHGLGYLWRSEPAW